MKLEGKTNEELLALRSEIENDPANRNVPGSSIFIYTTKASKKLQAITEQITHNMAEKRRLEGRPVPCEGYSGRKSNRRR